MIILSVSTWDEGAPEEASRADLLVDARSSPKKNVFFYNHPLFYCAFEIARKHIKKQYLASTVSSDRDMQSSVNTSGEGAPEQVHPLSTLRAEARDLTAIIFIHNHGPGQTAPSGVLA